MDSWAVHQHKRRHDNGTLGRVDISRHSRENGNLGVWGVAIIPAATP